MPLRTLLRYLVNNEELVRKIAESYPVRRAAQLTVSMLYKSREKVNSLGPNKIKMITDFLKKFQSNIREEIQDAKKQMKK